MNNLFEIKKYEIPFYRFKKFGNKYLVTTDSGAWIFLTEDEFYLFYNHSLSSELYRKLEEKNIIITPENRKNIVMKYLNFYWPRYLGASLLIVVPTLRCNFTCKYCYSYRKNENEMGYDMTLEVACKILDLIFQTPAPHIVLEFTGGEPLLNFEIIKYMIEECEKIKKYHNKSVSYAIVTNGYYLDEEKFNFLSKYGCGICISFDGPKELHDFHRKITNNPKQSSYDLVVEKIKWLFKEKYPFVFAIPVITKKSFAYWKEIIDEYVKLGILTYRFKFMSFFGFASNYKIWTELGATPEEFVEFWKKSVDYLIELNKKGIKAKENIAGYILAKLFRTRPAGFAELEIPCGATIGQLLFNYEGSIYPCDEARIFPNFRIGSVFTHKYEDLILHPTTTSLINASSMVESCYSCVYYPYCGSCPVEDYNRYKTMIVNIPSSYRCRVYKGMFDYIFQKLSEDEEVMKIFQNWVGV
ncbi:MAG: His-Xaa-Ser system radical SAM maturase HxsB [Candidatus Woesearchaeota archaeon]